MSKEGKMFEIFLFCRRELHILQQFAASKQFQSFVGRAWDGEGSWMVVGLNGKSYLWASRACRVVWGSPPSQELRRISRRRKWCATHESVVIQLWMTVSSWACCAKLDRHIQVPDGWLSNRSTERPLIPARLMIFRKCILEAVFEQIIATCLSHFKVDEMITPSSLNDDTRSMLTPLIVRYSPDFKVNIQLPDLA